MKIGLINEDSQADKNAMIFDILKQEAEKKGHTVFNYGMYTEQDSHQINFTQIGILAAVLLHSHAVDFVVTGCGTGQFPVMRSLMLFAAMSIHHLMRICLPR